MQGFETALISLFSPARPRHLRRLAGNQASARNVEASRKVNKGGVCEESSFVIINLRLRGAAVRFPPPGYNSTLHLPE